MKWKKKTKSVWLSLLVICIFLMTSVKTSAEYENEAPTRIDRDDGGHTMGNGAYVKFYYQFIRQSVDEVHGTATYKLGEWFSISGGQAQILSDYIYLKNDSVSNQYIGVFNKHNGWQSSGAYTRDVWLNVTLRNGRNYIIMRGAEGSDEGTGDAQIVVDIGKIGHDPVVHGVNSEWIAGEVGSGIRTWQSLYTDGATGSSEGNKQATSTGFFFSDEDEQKQQVAAYVNVPISNNASVTKIEKQNANGTWTNLGTARSHWQEMDNVGTYRLTCTSKDQAGYTATGTRIVTVRQKEYTVQYNGNGATSGAMSNSTHIYDTSKNLNVNTFTRSGWKFMGWNTKADGTGISYSDEQSVKNLSAVNGATINLYAIWDHQPAITASNKSYFEDEITSFDWIMKYRLQNVTAKDDEDGNLTNKLIVKSDNVNVAKAGTYQVVYEVTDSVGQTVTKSITVTIKQNNPPVIIAEDKTFYQNQYTQQEWEDYLIFEEISATDIEDGNITDKIKVMSDHVEMDKPGKQEVVYEVTDAYGKRSEKSIIVNILYNHQPVIIAENKVFHENELTPEKWQEEILKEISATDIEDGNVTSKIKIIQDTVDPSEPGAYIVTYEVTDSLGKTTRKTIDVAILENWEPVIQIFAGNKRFMEGQYTDLQWQDEIRMIGVTAHDHEDNDLTDKVVVIKDNTDPSVHGEYNVTYMVEDRWGKFTTKTIKVTVEENKAPEIFAQDKFFHVTDQIGSEDLLNNTMAIDDHDGDISDDMEIISSNVIQGVVGNYEVIYKVVDSFGKATEKKVNVYIIDDGSIVVPPNPPQVTDPNSLVIWNGRQLAKVQLTKEMEVSLFDDNAYKNVVFGIYAAEDIVYKGEVVLKKDSLVGISKLDENGNIDFMVYHAGKYYVQEISSDDRYQLSDEKYYFEFSYDD